MPLAVALVAVVMAAVFTARQERIYRTDTTLVVTPGPTVIDTADLLRSLDTLERRSIIATFARIPVTAETRDTIAKQLKLSAGSLSGYHIRASVVPNTHILRIEVEGGDPGLTTRVADTAADVTASEAAKLYPIYAMRTLARAAPPSRPASPEPARNYAVAGLLGLFLGVIAAVTTDYLNVSPAAPA